MKYNVIGGGQSALYGVEDVSFYFRNGLLNFNVMFMFTCIFPMVSILRWALEPKEADFRRQV